MSRVPCQEESAGRAGKGMPRKYMLIRECEECGKKYETKHLHQETCSRKCGTSLMRKRELTANEKGGIIQAWACGGGVQSTAIAALIVLGKLPKPDFAWIVDVGWEKQSTFDYTYDVLIPRLADVGVTLNIVKTVDYVDNSLIDGEFCRLPLYEKNIDGITRKYKTRCSGLWKQRVAHKWLKEQCVKRCDTWIGISVDEARRMKENQVKWNKIKYPLIELGLRREDCIDLVARIGWRKPEHTACYLCPNQSDYQWQSLKQDYPGDFQRAVEAEERLQAVNPAWYLHASCRPLKDIQFNAVYGGLFTGKECYGDCGPIQQGGGRVQSYQGPMLVNRMGTHSEN